ncbi:MAG: hypothetical protein V3W32_03315 [Gemmatimonadota bacterium]
MSRIAAGLPPADVRRLTGPQGRGYPLSMPIGFTLIAPAITGLPWNTWLLLIAAIVPGLVLVLRFYAVHRDRDRSAAPRERDSRG